MQSNGNAETAGVDVWKFGGSSFSSPAAYNIVARAAASSIAAGRKLCIVVSAMSGTTGRLSELLEEIAPDHRPEDRDAVLGTGEILATALMTSALVKAGIDARSLHAHQLGWQAAGTFTDGKLIDTPADTIRASLQSHAAVVIAGGQALCGDKLMMLGRNSSDLTAIAVARSLGTFEATIFSDIEGVCSADPYLVDDAVLIRQLSYDHALQYAELGAKVLHARSIETARAGGIAIQCATLLPNGTILRGTCVGVKGDGVQVSFPSDAGLLHLDTDAHPPEGVSVLAAVHNNKQYVVRGAGTSNGPLVPLITVDRQGCRRGFAVPRAEAREQALQLHKALLEQIEGDDNFIALGRIPQKMRGTHSAVLGVSER